jgi:hypothetical protein
LRRLLLEDSIDFDSKDADGRTVLSYAAERDAESVKVLLDLRSLTMIHEMIPAPRRSGGLLDVGERQ